MKTRRQLAALGGLIALLAAAWLVYRPGLAGPYLFDDFANLPALGATGPINDGASLARYLTSGVADPTGRPVALASFLIDARDWPADPEPFKRTNLILHLLNGALLFWLLCCLDREKANPAGEKSALVAAWLGTAMWLLHPLFVSTTLYIVQREAMLPATFTLLGLLGWWHGRRRIATGRVRHGVVLASASIATCTLLGALAKANGILLPVLVLVLEYTVARIDGLRLSEAQRNSYRWGVLAPCWAIALLVAGYLTWFVVRSLWMDVAPVRPWTLGQRLLTEPRILWDYARLLWLPHPYTAGVFNDQVEASTGFLTPWTTVPAIVGSVGITALAVLWRARTPALSAALLFFVCGHAIESTSIPLELYFEHRNYLPALLMFWPLARWLGGSTGRPGRERERLAGGLIILLLLGGLTRMNAMLWGDARDQALLWAELNPSSDRAQANAAASEIDRGEPEKAERRLRPLLAVRPDQVQLAFNLLAARCAQGSVSHRDLESTERALRTTHDPGTLLVTWFDRAIAIAEDGSCRGFDVTALRSLVQAGMSNDYLPPGRYQDLLHLEGRLYLDAGDGSRAAETFDRGLALDPRISAALEQAALLGSEGYPALGLRHLTLFDKLASSAPAPAVGMPTIHAWVLEHQAYWKNERAHLESTLRKDAGETFPAGPTP